MSPTDIQAAISHGRMSRFQVNAVAACTTLNMLDGYDVLVVAYTASSIAADWGLSGAQLGVLLGAGLFGMAGGALFLAPWADRFGRRAMILFCLGLLTAGMLASAAARDVVQLTVLRVVTGLGIGGMLASLGVITSEYSSDKWRSTNISVQATGYPVGATVGGVIAAYLIAQYGWRSAYLLGALASALMVPLVLRTLPESMDFLLARRRPDALERVNALLRRMGRATVTELPPPAPVLDERQSSNPLRGLFAGPLVRSTLLIWSTFFLHMFGFYFIMSWTPRLLVSAGLSTQQGITGGVLLNVGGIVGGLLFAWLSSRLPLRGLTAAFLVSTAMAAAAFGLFATGLGAAFVIALAIGVFMVGAMAGLYSLAPVLYPASVRTTGVGWAIGIGRIGAILAPVIAGFLVDAGWTTRALYLGYAASFVGAVLTVRAIKKGDASF